MKVLVVAVGDRMPRWVDEAFAEYARRMPRTARVQLVEIRPEPRHGGKPLAALLEAEAMRIARSLPPGFRSVALDEHGKEFSTLAFSRWLSRRIDESIDTAFLIGGPDGLSPRLKERAELLLRLSAMTLPHGLARVVLAEQLYRALSVIGEHPYHRG